MDRFHIYDQLGSGRFPTSSLVYKGRERRTITYVGIKRVPKEKMVQVGGFVSLLHRLGVEPKTQYEEGEGESSSSGSSSTASTNTNTNTNTVTVTKRKKRWFPSPFVVRFQDWYETRSNLWLILEFVPGGSLEGLLKSTKGESEMRTRRLLQEERSAGVHSSQQKIKVVGLDG